LTFSLGDESYGLPVLNVREIIRLCPITPVPRMPPHVKGVINLRGTVIAVLDLRAKFQLTPKAYGERTCIIVVQVAAPSGGSTLMGAVVDAVEEVVQLGSADIEATSRSASDSSASWAATFCFKTSTRSPCICSYFAARSTVC